MSFYEYLTGRLENIVDPLRSLDSLHLAETFLDYKLNSVLIDMSGVVEHGYDMSYVVACDVLNAECTKDKQFPKETKMESVVTNVRNHSDADLNVTDLQLELINDVIETYDCNFMSILQHKRMKILYARELIRIFKTCHGKTYAVTTRDDLVQHIVRIAKYGGTI
jgi:hypothetical protein